MIVRRIEIIQLVVVFTYCMDRLKFYKARGEPGLK